MSSPLILEVAVAGPLRQVFDYRLEAPESLALDSLAGRRVALSFGRQQAIGLVCRVKDETSVAPTRLKAVSRLLDDDALVKEGLFKLLQWACNYYHHAPGEVYFLALPPALRKLPGHLPPPAVRWCLTVAGRAVDASSLARAPRQQQLLRLLQQTPQGLDRSALAAQAGDWRPVLRRFVQQGWVEEMVWTDAAEAVGAVPVPTPALSLGSEQAQAVAAVCAGLQGFGVFLLQGVTGSGKTEVYFSIIEQVLAAGRQVVLLTPEINLTPQLLQRVRRRFSGPVAVLHSALADGEKLRHWEAFRTGASRLLVGTRSAVFAPAANLGLIVVDEEHDASFKQQEGFRYHARDVAVMRAHLENIPVVLGSATPSLESLHNAGEGRYQRLRLPQRAGGAQAPRVLPVDMRREAKGTLLSAPLLVAMGRHLAAGNQVLLFLNRRGYAPVLLCHDCGWSALCPRCDVHYTWHRGDRRLRCHHCGAEKPVPAQCPQCSGTQLLDVGAGTQKVEETLVERFPGVTVTRVDRDSTRRKGAMQNLLESVEKGGPCILVGTQLLAKGHDFPHLTLVGVLDADQGLFSSDFRAPERLAQLLVQVTGRAGRGDKAGEVYVQTHQPEHPVLTTLINKGYEGFAELALTERRQLALPPYSYQALLRCRAKRAEAAQLFLRQARECAAPPAEVQVLGPVPAPMERRGGDYRYHLLLQSGGRRALHAFLDAWLPQLEQLPSGRRVHWTLDVDPVDLY